MTMTGLAGGFMRRLKLCTVRPVCVGLHSSELFAYFCILRYNLQT